MNRTRTKALLVFWVGRAAGADQHFYLFLLDLHASPAVEAVAASCPLPHLLLRMPPHFFMQGGAAICSLWHLLSAPLRMNH